MRNPMLVAAWQRSEKPESLSLPGPLPKSRRANQLRMWRRVAAYGRDHSIPFSQFRSAYFLAPNSSTVAIASSTSGGRRSSRVFPSSNLTPPLSGSSPTRRLSSISCHPIVDGFVDFHTGVMVEHILLIPDDYHVLSFSYAVTKLDMTPTTRGKRPPRFGEADDGVGLVHILKIKDSDVFA